MKKKLLIFSGLASISLGAALFISGGLDYAKAEKAIPIDSVLPDQNEPRKIHAILKVQPFNESVKTADAIIRLKIKEKVKEIGSPYDKTIFNAEVLEVFKGNTEKINKNIDVMQQGTEMVTFNDNNLFEPNQELILFLKQSQVYKNTYWILGEETNMYEINGDMIEKKAYKDKQLESLFVSSKKSDDHSRNVNLVKDEFIKKLKEETINNSLIEGEKNDKKIFSPNCTWMHTFITICCFCSFDWSLGF